MPAELLINLRMIEQKSTPLHLAYASFMLDAEAPRLTTKTLKYYKEHLQPFLDQMHKMGAETPASIFTHLIRAYMVSQQKRGLVDASVQAAARVIRAFCDFLVREELLAQSPMPKVRMPKMEKPIKRAFTPAQVEAILKAMDNPRDKAIVLALLDMLSSQ